MSDEALKAKVKAELRKRMRGLRKAATVDACEARSRKITAALLALPFVASARTIALFWPIEGSNEVDLRELDRTVRGQGKRVAYPSIDPETREMCMRFVEDPTAMTERGKGFAEPGETDPRADELDVVVVPALAVDPAGHRIGYGAGYYDRTLPRYCPPAVSVSVAYDYQMMVEMPFTERDVRTSFIVTDLRTLEAERPGQLPRPPPPAR